MRIVFVAIILGIVPIILPCEGYRILGIFSYNGHSHFVMYERLLKGLAERGHRVDVVSHFPPKVQFPNYNQIVDLSGTVPSMVNNLTYDFAMSKADSEVPMIVSLLGCDLCDLMDQPGVRSLIENPPQDPPYDILIVDIFAATCYLGLGKHLQVPIVGTVSSALWPWVNDMVANPDNPAYLPSVFSSFDSQMNFWERAWNAFELMHEKMVFNQYSTCREEKMKKYIGPNAPSLEEAEKNVSLILVNSHHSLNGVRPFTTGVVEVGGLHIPKNVKSLPNDLEKWMNDSADGFIFISFGSMMKIESFPEATLRALYKSIKKLSPIRVLMKIVNAEELPPGLPDNVLTRPWIPQLAVLSHKRIRVFMTHGGLLGTQEAVYYGVPMIGVPLFADQAQNIKHYVRKHAAVSIDNKQLTEENLDAAFNTLLKDPSYMEAAKRLSEQFRDRPMSAIDTAIFWVEYVGRHGGANLRSPAMNLTWWQTALLDIFGALLFSTILAIYLAKLIIIKSINVVRKMFNKSFVIEVKSKKVL